VKLHGIFPPITTPFDHRGDLYLAKLKYNVEKWNRTQLAGYVVCGSTGESVMLTCEEKVRLWETVREAAAPEKLLIAGTGVESVRETVQLCNLAAGLGYQAAMVRTPHYYKNLINNGPAQACYFRAVADQSKIPIIIYNWPQVTGVDIPAATVIELAAHPNIIAVKESSGNIDLVAGPEGRGRGRHSGLRQRRAVRLPVDPGGGPNPRGPGRTRTPAALRPGCGRRHHQARYPRPQIRDGPQRLLRRPAAAASSPAGARGPAGDRRGFSRR
jgi:hypothetical protein